MALAPRDENHDMRLAATALFSRRDGSGKPVALARSTAAAVIGHMRSGTANGGLGTSIFTVPLAALEKAGCNMSAWQKSGFALNADNSGYLVPEEFVINGAMPILEAWAGKGTQYQR